MQFRNSRRHKEDALYEVPQREVQACYVR
jgi:hypothetical protein